MKLVVPVLVLAVAPGCAALLGLDDPATGDEPVDAQVTDAAAVEIPSGWTVERLAQSSQYVEWSPTLREDGRELYYASFLGSSSAQVVVSKLGSDGEWSE